MTSPWIWIIVQGRILPRTKTIECHLSLLSSTHRYISTLQEHMVARAASPWLLAILASDWWDHATTPPLPPKPCHPSLSDPNRVSNRTRNDSGSKGRSNRSRSEPGRGILRRRSARRDASHVQARAFFEAEEGRRSVWDPMATFGWKGAVVAAFWILARPAWCLYGGGSKVISLTTSNFAKETRGPAPVLVEFYAPYVLRRRRESNPRCIGR